MIDVYKRQILEHGKIALDAKLFSEIIRKLPDSMIWLESDEELNVTITCEKSNFRIAGKPGDEFSYLPYIERNKYILSLIHIYHIFPAPQWRTGSR